VKTVAVIPARYGSSRLPGKPLIQVKAKPLIQHVYERVKASSVQHVVVATDDERIATAVREFGGEAVMTSPHHRSGTERVAEAAAHLESDIVVNVQGDEPLILPGDIDRAVTPFALDSAIMATTLITPLLTGADLYNPHAVKVVVDHEGFALYFSRAPIPYPQDLLAKADGQPLEQRVLINTVDKRALKGYWHHIGLYAFRRDFLLKIVDLPPGHLERRERLEQLRILENGFKLKTVVCSAPSIGIDTQEDVERFKSLIESPGGLPGSP
jgi:3-deoxy-manno-octulosonate cytidylyltransferase (CMP-KDO synthetase)